MTADIRELTADDFARAMPRKQRERIISECEKMGTVPSAAHRSALLSSITSGAPWTVPDFFKPLGGRIDPVKDIVALRRFAGLTQEEFAEALAISVHTLRNCEQGRRTPEGPALALLRVAARHREFCGRIWPPLPERKACGLKQAPGLARTSCQN